jgi:hypothetical protein
VEEEKEEVTTSYGIPNTNAFTGSGSGGGGGIGGPFDPYTAQPSGSYITNRTNFGNTGYIRGTEPEETYMGKIGNLIKSGIGMAIPGGNFLINMAENQHRNKRLSATDNAFIDMQLANQEQSVHGGNLTNQDRYGYNKVSMFGNYADLVKERVEIANKRIAEGKDLRDIDQYYLEKEKEQDEINKQIEFNDWMNQRVTANKIRAAQKAGVDLGPTGIDVHGGLGDGGTTITNQTGDGGGHVRPPGTYDTDTSTGGSGDHRTQTSSWSQPKNQGTTPGAGLHADYNQGGRVGFFAHGGRVYLNLGGLASLL